MATESLFENTALENPLKIFESIHNRLYANDGLSEQQTLEEMVKLLFVKYHDEQSQAQQFALAADKHAAADAAEAMHALFAAVKKRYGDYFDDGDKLMISQDSLVHIIKKLQHIDFSQSRGDTYGVAFQKFLGRHAKAGRGQFFTPDPVIDYCVQIISPQPHEKIIDPTCGTGGFLYSATSYINTHHKQADIAAYVRDNVYGIEINKKIAQIAKIKFLLQAGVSPHIISDNALKPLDAFTAFEGAEGKCAAGAFDIVLTNPPFGGQGKVSDASLLSRYALGHRWVKCGNSYEKNGEMLSGQAPDVLFIEQCLNLLKPGGRMGIVLPNGHFENSSMDYIRAYIKSQAAVTGVVLLPQETFVPYGTGVKVSLLFLQKNNGETVNNGKVFFSKITKLGYSGNKNGTPIYKRDSDGNIAMRDQSKILDEDFTESAADYEDFLRKFAVRSPQSYCLDSAELKNRFDYNFYAPDYRELISYLQDHDSVKLGEVCTIVRNKFAGLKNNDAVQYIELSDIHTQSYEIINSSALTVAELPSRASYTLCADDIITAVAGNSIGTAKHATAYVTSEHEGAICTNGFRVLRGCQINPYYLLYYLQSDLFLKQVFMHRTGTAIPAISDADFANILVYLPPDEQMAVIIDSVKKSFSLRRAAKQEMASIKNALPGSHNSHRALGR